jgi:hypothetical protein
MSGESHVRILIDGVLSKRDHVIGPWGWPGGRSWMSNPSRTGKGLASLWGWSRWCLGAGDTVPIGPRRVVGLGELVVASLLALFAAPYEGGAGGAFDATYIIM